MSALSNIRTLARRRVALASSALLVRPAQSQFVFLRWKSKRAGKDEGAVAAAGSGGGKRGLINTAELVPGSQQKMGTDEARAAYEDAEKKMQGTVEHHRRELAALEMRGSGRVTPAILDAVRVQLPDRSALARLQDVATVGVREGTTLLVSVYDESSLKHVEKAIYAAKIPHVVPQKVDGVTLKIPMPKPTVEARKALAVQGAKLTEDLRVQLRRTREAGEKKAKAVRHSKELDEFHKLMTKYIAEIDKNLEKFKKSVGS
ncbi:ribosome recycling factor [Auricularia subglabra TFB-10046 SS5]|nr:ribosome recycling factor [Auricularia subglabra TFB-10046 SS5]